jgi:hypothetical protein
MDTVITIAMKLVGASTVFWWAVIGVFLFAAVGAVFPWMAKNRRMWEDRNSPWQDKLGFGLVMILFLIGDLAFSVGWGQPIVLRRIPRLQLFTTSLIWAKRYGNSQQKKRAAEWCKVLEKHDPGHCR